VCIKSYDERNPAILQLDCNCFFELQGVFIKKKSVILQLLFKIDTIEGFRGYVKTLAPSNSKTNCRITPKNNINSLCKPKTVLQLDCKKCL